MSRHSSFMFAWNSSAQYSKQRAVRIRATLFASHLPKIGEAPLQTSTSPGGSAGGRGGSGKVDINTADASLFETLPGIGEVKAGAIVRYREANGAFTDVEQLLDVSGIGPATLDAIHELIEVR